MKPPGTVDWSPDEIAFLRDNVGNYTDKTLGEAMCAAGFNRTWRAVRKMRERMGLMRRPHLIESPLAPPKPRRKGRGRSVYSAQGWPEPQGDRVFLRRLAEALSERRAA